MSLYEENIGHIEPDILAVFVDLWDTETHLERLFYNNFVQLLQPNLY